MNSKARRLEDELESTNERARVFEQDLNEQRMSAEKLQARLAQAEAAAQDARMDLEREKAAREVELQQRLDEERTKWRLEVQPQTLLGDPNNFRADSLSTSQRRHSPTCLAYTVKEACLAPYPVAWTLLFHQWIACLTILRGGLLAHDKNQIQRYERQN